MSTVHKRIGLRLHRLLVRWGLLKHPYGRTYAKNHITMTGKPKDDTAASEDDQ